MTTAVALKRNGPLGEGKGKRWKSATNGCLKQPKSKRIRTPLCLTNVPAPNFKKKVRFSVPNGSCQDTCLRVCIRSRISLWRKTVCLLLSRKTNKINAHAEKKWSGRAIWECIECKEVSFWLHAGPHPINEEDTWHNTHEWPSCHFYFLLVQIWPGFFCARF